MIAQLCSILLCMKESYMSFQICIKTDRSLQQLAAEIRTIFSLPPFNQNSFAGEPYCQFEMLGMIILIHPADEEDRDPEVKSYPYCFDLQMRSEERRVGKG